MSYLTNCPPCDANFPILCEPLETTAKGKRLVVEDAAACQKTIQTPAGQQILKTDGAGNLSWTNGANDTVLTKSASGVIEFTVISNQIPDGSITTDKLAGAAVTTSKLETNSVTTLKIADSAVTEPKIATDAVTSSKIQNLSVTVGKLGTNEQKQICKAWVNFNGTTSPGTIRSSYNVSSITKNGTGDYTVNFTTAMSDVNYSISGVCSVETTDTGLRGVTINARTGATPKTTTAFRIWVCENTTSTDRTHIDISIFGN